MAFSCSRRVLRVLAAVAGGALVLGAMARAQSSTRRSTNLAALAAYPNFYHLQPILLVGTLSQGQDGEFRLSDGATSIRVVPQGQAPDGVDEVRGQFWDLGRMKADDPRLAGYDLRTIFHVNPDGAWPRPGEVTAIMASAISPAAPLPGPPTPSIRAVVLDAPRFLDQPVTIVGQYQGRNLMGDLPDAPRISRYDFVVRSADAAIWVTNLRPKGKDARGHDVELGLDARIETGRWLRISGVVKQTRGLLWIDGQAGSLALIPPPAEEAPAAPEAPAHTPTAPAPEVVFSAPTADETDVALTARVRMQFSRDLDAKTLKGHIRVAYAPGVADTAPPPPVEFAAEYLPANRVVELKFAKPLERFRTVTVEIVDGLLGTDQQPVRPWKLTFSV
ncbi:MAG: Ig-like domain-containing protein, partial [Acidobacteriota bacterium]